MESNWRHEAFYTIRTYEIDSKKQATLPALVKLLHESAMEHVIRLGVSVWDLEPHHIAWVLMRQQLSLLRLPRLGERIRVETYPSGYERLFTYRDYKVYDEAGELIAHSSSTWVLMDTVRRNLARFPEFILDILRLAPAPELCLPRPSGQMPKMELPEYALEFTVRWHELDFNNHLNNMYYQQWMLEAIPDELLMEGRLLAFDIQYRAEAQWKEHVKAETQQLPEGQLLHRLVRQEDGKELALAVSSWQ